MATVSKILVAGGFLLSTALMGCVSQSKYDALAAQNVQLQQELSAEQVQVTRLQGAIKYTVESDLLFSPGSWEMSEAGKQILAQMTEKLAPTQRNKLVVNGYTDNVPIGPDLERQGVISNQVLSEKRAEAVKNFLIEQGVNPNMVTAVGHGESNPVASNDSPEGRSKNRRVELTFGG